MIAGHVADITVPLDEYPAVGLTATLHDAFQALTNQAHKAGHPYRHVLVLNPNNELVGLIGMRELLHGLFPDYLRSHEHRHFEGASSEVASLTTIWSDTCDAQCPVAAQRPVRDFMGPIRGPIDSQAPITLAAYLMVDHQTSLLPVIDQGRVIGVCRLTDVFQIAYEHIHHGQQ
jgi:CBS domain-containing protein